MPKPASTPPKSTASLADRWIEVFRAGTHVSSSGDEVTFSQSDLDQMIVNHVLFAAPAVIGHPKGNGPAYARVQEYKREGDRLFCKFQNVNPAFDAGVQSGAYYSRSLSVYKDKQHGWRVRHVGWLGDVPPAIDGLEPVSFSAAADADILEFSVPGYSLVWGLEGVAGLLRGLRENMIAKDGIDAANSVLPQWQIDSALDAVRQARQEFQDAFREEAQEAQEANSQVRPNFNHPEGHVMTFTQAQLDAARQAGQEAARAEFAAQEQELTRLKAERLNERVAAQINGWKSGDAPKLLPAEEEGLAEFMVALDGMGATEFNFSAHDGKALKKSPAQWFAEFMAKRPAVVKVGHRSAADNLPVVDMTNARAIAEAAQEFMASEAKAGRIITVESAVAHINKASGQSR